MALLARISAYASHDDPRAAAGNVVSLVVASNQPFYPLYLYFAVGPVIWPSFLTFLSTPFFLAVPAVARRWPAFGRALLPLTGIANTAIAVKAFGAASAVELFLLPCLALGALLFRPGERVWTWLVAVSAAAVYFALPGWSGPPLHDYSAGEYASFARLNAMSVATLTLFVGLLFSAIETGPRESAR